MFDNRGGRTRSRWLRRPALEELEARVTPSSLPLPPDPLHPGPGQRQLLEVVNQISGRDIRNALDHFPVPYVVIAQAGNQDPVVVDRNAGSPVRVDVDRSKATGQGNSGHDIEVEVNTELVPTPHLVLTVNRLGTSNFVKDFTVLIAFPFNAFNAEDATLPGKPNLFIGYQTRAAGAPGDIDGEDGGIAPLTEEIIFTPHILAGTDHDFELEINTTGAANPLRFLAGHFDDANFEQKLNATGIAAYVRDVPSHIGVALDVGEFGGFLGGGETDTAFELSWAATAPTLATFDYFEHESPVPFAAPNFNTTLTADRMPTSATLALRLDEAAGTFTLSHRANAVIERATLLHQRSDGLTIIGTAADIPTAVDLTLTLAGSVTLDVNANTLDLKVEAIQQGGFFDTADFLGYDLGYAALAVTDAPDLTAGYLPADDRFGVVATNPGESIGAVELVIDDDAHYVAGPGGAPVLVGLDLPPSYADVPTHHLFSLVDDGTHGTAVARIVRVREASLDLDPDATQAFHLVLGQPTAPMQAYLRTTPDSNVVPGHDVEITCDIDNVPFGVFDIHFDGPGDFGYTTDPPQRIASIHCFGHIDSFNFDVAAGDLPAAFDLDFDPGSHLTVFAGDGLGGPDRVGFVSARFFDENGFSPTMFPDTSALFGEPLKDARFRVDAIPSFHAAWSDGGGSTAISFDTDAASGPFAFLGGAQFAVSTAVGLTDELPVGNAAAAHYLRFIDAGAGGAKQLAAGAFGIDQFTYTSNDAAGALSVHYVANEAHLLTAVFDSGFGGRYFPDFDVFVTLTVGAVPQTFDLTVDLDQPSFNYTADDEIDAVTVAGTLDVTDNGVNDGFNLNFAALGLPRQVAFSLDAAAGATLTMNDAIDFVGLVLTGPAGILGSPFRLIQASMEDIPAQWVVNWGGAGFLIEAKDAFGDPTPMGRVTATVSTSSGNAANLAKVAPFTLVTPGGARVEYSPFLQRIDERYYNAGIDTTPSTVLAFLQELYNDGERLDAGEDHLIVRLDGGAVDFATLQFTGFQKASATPDANGGQYVLSVPGAPPTPGADHGFFAGFEKDDVFTTLQIQNIPESVVVDIDKSSHITYDANESAGEIDFYTGPFQPGVGLFANDADSATRAILKNTPAFVHLTWGFGFPEGGVNFDASNPFELLLLTQNGSKRITGGLQMEDLQIGYDIDLLSFEETDSVLGVPIAWEVFSAKVGIDNDASDPEIQGNPDKQPVNGFFALYDFLNSPEDLNDGTPADGGEYVPLITVQEQGFTEFSFELLVELDPTNPGADLYPFDIETNLTLTGNLVLDLWSSANTFFSDGDAIPFIPEVGFENRPDYTENDPFHILPGFNPLDPTDNAIIGNPRDLIFTFEGWHEFDDHFDPFAGTPDPFDGTTGGGYSPGDLLFRIQTVQPFLAALQGWQEAGVGPATIASLREDTTIVIADLPGAVLGSASGSTIQIDPDAGGFAWFIDPTPFDHDEYGGGPAPADLVAGGGSPALGKVDMVTFFAHEIGHLLGLEHTTAGVMKATLPRGVRRLPVPEDLSSDPPGSPGDPSDPDEGALTVDVGLLDPVGEPFQPAAVAAQRRAALNPQAGGPVGVEASASPTVSAPVAAAPPPLPADRLVIGMVAAPPRLEPVVTGVPAPRRLPEGILVGPEEEEGPPERASQPPLPPPPPLKRPVEAARPHFDARAFDAVFAQEGGADITFLDGRGLEPERGGLGATADLAGLVAAALAVAGGTHLPEPQRSPRRQRVGPAPW